MPSFPRSSALVRVPTFDLTLSFAFALANAGSDSDEEAGDVAVVAKLTANGQVVQISVSVQYGKKTVSCRLSPYLPVENAVFFILREFNVDPRQAPLSDYKVYKLGRRSTGSSAQALLDSQQSLVKQNVREGVRGPGL